MGRINQEHSDGAGRCGRVGEDGLDGEDKVSVGPWGRVSRAEGGRWRRMQPPNKEKQFSRFFTNMNVCPMLMSKITVCKSYCQK
jgi:hypothetical protein